MKDFINWQFNEDDSNEDRLYSMFVKALAETGGEIDGYDFAQKVLDAISEVAPKHAKHILFISKIIELPLSRITGHVPTPVDPFGEKGDELISNIQNIMEEEEEEDEDEDEDE